MSALFAAMNMQGRRIYCGLCSGVQYLKLNVYQVTGERGLRSFP